MSCVQCLSVLAGMCMIASVSLFYCRVSLLNISCPSFTVVKPYTDQFEHFEFTNLGTLLFSYLLFLCLRSDIPECLKTGDVVLN